MSIELEELNEKCLEDTPQINEIGFKIKTTSPRNKSQKTYVISRLINFTMKFILDCYDSKLVCKFKIRTFIIVLFNFVLLICALIGAYQFFKTDFKKDISGEWTHIGNEKSETNVTNVTNLLSNKISLEFFGGSVKIVITNAKNEKAVLQNKLNQVFNQKFFDWNYLLRIVFRDEILVRKSTEKGEKNFLIFTLDEQKILQVKFYYDNEKFSIDYFKKT